MRSRAILGIDIGGTKSLYALFDERFRVVDEVKVKTNAQKGEKQFSENLVACVKRLIRTAEKKKLVVMGTGVGCAGLIDSEEGVLKVSPNIPFLKDYAFAQRLRKLTGTPVYVGNDVQMGLYGEHQLGVAVGLQHVIGVFFGTGLGGALIINGKLHRGATGAAGDIGHYLVSPLGPLSGSERQGVLDDLVSRNAIAGAAATIASKHGAPHLYQLARTEVDAMRSGILAESIKRGDKKIEELVRSRARMAGIVLSNFVDFLRPDMVVLGGGLVDAMPSLFLKEIEAGIRDHVAPEIKKTVRVAVTKFNAHVVTAGAAKMAWDHFVPSEKAAA